MLREDDAVRLRHMMDAAEEAIRHAHGRDRDELDDDRQLLHSLVRCIEIIGEAANNTSAELQADHPEILWPRIIGMRNRLVHGYFDINHILVWKTVREELPGLVAQVQAILSEEG